MRLRAPNPTTPPMTQPTIAPAPLLLDTSREGRRLGIPVTSDAPCEEEVDVIRVWESVEQPLWIPGHLQLERGPNQTCYLPLKIIGSEHSGAVRLMVPGRRGRHNGDPDGEGNPFRKAAESCMSLRHLRTGAICKRGD